MVDVHLELHLEELFPLLSMSDLPSLWLILDKPTFSVVRRALQPVFRFVLLIDCSHSLALSLQVSLAVWRVS